MPFAPHRLLPILVCSIVALAGCGGDERRAADADVAPVEPSGDARFTLRGPVGGIALVEGAPPVSVALTLARRDGFTGAVTLAARDTDGTDTGDAFAQFSDDRLDADQSTAQLSVSLDIGPRALRPQQRTLRVSASDDDGATAMLDLTLQITPTSAPDVYLLIGQSNMVGFSQPDARQAQPGQPDATDSRIRQLNPTGNDQANFDSEADFTDEDSIVAEPRLSLALDPLHDGFNTVTDDKAGRFVGAGLSFAKAALADTTADIVLVPAAWSDTGFCSRSTNVLPGVGWLPEPSVNPAFAGTLLHDRAIARTDLAIEQSGGVLRGILWHQGEADVAVDACAAAYADNLAAMVASLRSAISVDARGPSARGPAADIPFVVGTMSQGTDERGSQLPFSPNKRQVDAAHRNVAGSIAVAGVVIADDLVPPAYPCGQSSCVHFGAAALREMGARYYRVMRELVDAP